MGGAVPPLPQYAFMAWCLGRAHGVIIIIIIIIIIYLFITAA
jgi:hypothetical protein